MTKAGSKLTTSESSHTTMSPRKHREALPEGLALAPAGGEPGQDLVILHHAPRPPPGGHAARVVGAAAVDHHDLGHQPGAALTSSRRTASTIGPTVLADVQRGQAHRHGEALPRRAWPAKPLGIEVRALEGAPREPFVPVDEGGW